MATLMIIVVVGRFLGDLEEMTIKMNEMAEKKIVTTYQSHL